MMCNLPDILYKYRSISEDDRSNGPRPYTKNIFTKGEIYFSRFSELGDPNEAIFDYIDEQDIAVNKDVLDEYPNFTEKEQILEKRYRLRVDGRTAAMHVRKQIDAINGIFCLSKEKQSLLMYDYYAGGHKGICIGFDWKRLGLLYEETGEHQPPKEIEYCSKPPVVNSSDPKNFENIENIFYTKWKEYKHEKELRLRYTPGIYKCKNNVLSAIREIIFGCAVTQADREMVKNWAEPIENVSYYEVYLTQKKYKLSIRRM